MVQRLAKLFGTDRQRSCYFIICIIPGIGNGWRIPLPQSMLNLVDPGI